MYAAPVYGVPAVYGASGGPAHGQGQGQAFPRNMQPRGMMMSPRGRFAQAPANLRTSEGSLQTPNPTLYNYGQNTAAYQQANAIYAGLPSAQSPLYAAPTQMAPLQTDIFNYVDPEASLAPWRDWRILCSRHLFASGLPWTLNQDVKGRLDELLAATPRQRGRDLGARHKGGLSNTLEAHRTLRISSPPFVARATVEPVLSRKGRKAKRATNGRKSSKQPVAATVDFDEDEEGGFGFDPEPEPKQPEVAPVSGGARRPSRSMTRVERHKEEEEKVTASRVAAAIDSSVKEAVGSRLDDITRQQIDNIEHRIAKRRAMIEKRRLALLQEQGAESRKTLETLEEVFQGRTENAAPPAHRPTQQHPAPPAPAPYTTPMSLEVLERERGSRPVSPAPQRALPDAESVIGDPTAMWDAIVASDATASVKLNAAKKQLLYFQQEELLIQQKLAEAEQTLMRPRHFSENDTVFDDNFENGTIIDDTGEVFGFGAL